MMNNMNNQKAQFWADAQAWAADLFSKNPRFVEWLIGFSEGDGGFHFYDYSGHRKTREISLKYAVTQSTWDVKILHEILDQLGIGRVEVASVPSYIHRFIVRDEISLLKIIALFNGRFQFNKKREQFASFVKNFNNAFGYSIELSPQIDLVSLNYSWIAGLVAAEGCFTCSVINRGGDFSQVQVRMMITQKDEPEVMSKLAKIFKGRNSDTKKGITNMAVQLTLLDTAIKYFEAHPLRTRKQEVYDVWLDIRKMVMNRDHLTGKIDAIKAKIELTNQLNGPKSVTAAALAKKEKLLLEQSQAVVKVEQPQAVVKVVQNQDSAFNEWFIGFTESRGGFQVSNHIPLSFHVLVLPSEVKILHYIRDQLGYGQVRVLSDRAEYVVTGVNLQNLIEIFNGRIQLKANQEEFNKFITKFNAKEGKTIPVLAMKDLIRKDSPWMSGMLSGGSSWVASIFSRTLKTPAGEVKGPATPIARLMITRGGEEEALKRMSVVFGGSVSSKRCLTIRQTKIQPLIAYLEKYPLVGGIAENYKEWVVLINMMTGRKDMLAIEKQIAKIKVLNRGNNTEKEEEEESV